MENHYGYEDHVALQRALCLCHSIPISIFNYAGPRYENASDRYTPIAVTEVRLSLRGSLNLDGRRPAAEVPLGGDDHVVVAAHL